MIYEWVHLVQSKFVEVHVIEESFPVIKSSFLHKYDTC